MGKCILVSCSHVNLNPPTTPPRLAFPRQAKLEPEQRTALIEAGKKLKDQVAAAEERVAALEAELQSEGQRLPNLTHPAVPIGGEELATVLRMVGAQREFDFAFKNHVEVAEALDLVDFDAASDVRRCLFLRVFFCFFFFL